MKANHVTYRIAGNFHAIFANQAQSAKNFTLENNYLASRAKSLST